MTGGAPLLDAVRRALEAEYGLALEGLGEDQIAAAVYGAAAEGMADPLDPGFLLRVVDRLPIDESWLFRDDGLWEWLRDDAGPDMLERAGAAGRPVRVLSLGCSAGQEPFTAAMLFQDLVERSGLPPSGAASFAQVVGVDSSLGRIEAARSGSLPSWSVQRCREDWLRGRVSPEEGQAGRFRVAPSVQAMCRFEVGNLVELVSRGNAALGGYDLVLCRNVLIYFRSAQAEHIAGALGRALDRGAHLVFSAAEAHLLAASPLERCGHLGAGRAAPLASAALVREVRSRRAARLGRSSARTTARVTPCARGAPAQVGSDARGLPHLARARAAEGAVAELGGLPPDRHHAVTAHVEEAIRQAAAGRSGEALREARAALFHDPRHLYSRLLLGQHLIPVDGERGREVLRELLQAAARLPPEDAVPCADGLSVGQLAAAARILLARGGDS